MVEQRVRGILKAVDLQKAYQTRVLGLDIQARVPFVKVDETDRAVRLIKPGDSIWIVPLLNALASTDSDRPHTSVVIHPASNATMPEGPIYSTSR
ncbi:hypothetical protein FHX57_007448 [Paraburkholderia tropica]|nr:hypothetical protein [Paraburkholderia tropica]MBB6324002.1 hypothetical protein [Paraburkholderia tropica]